MKFCSTIVSSKNMTEFGIPLVVGSTFQGELLLFKVRPADDELLREADHLLLHNQFIDSIATMKQSANLLCASAKHNDLVMVDCNNLKITKVNIENKAKGMNNSKYKTKVTKIDTNQYNNQVGVIKEDITVYDSNIQKINTLKSCTKYRNFAFCKNLHYLFALSEQNTMDIWDLRTNKIVSKHNFDKLGKVANMKCHRNKLMLISAQGPVGIQDLKSIIDNDFINAELKTQNSLVTECNSFDLNDKYAFFGTSQFQKDCFRVADLNSGGQNLVQPWQFEEQLDSNAKNVIQKQLLSQSVIPQSASLQVDGDAINCAIGGSKGRVHIFNINN